MGQPFRSAAIVSQKLIGFRAAGTFHGDLLKLLFEFLFRELPAFQPAASFHDFLDIEFEDIAPAELALGALAPTQKNSKAPPALLQRKLDFLANLVVIRDRFLGLAGKWHPDRSHMDEDHHRAGGKSASRLRNPVVAPGGVEHRLERRTRRLLVEKRYAIGVANDARQLVIVVLLLAFSKRHALTFLFIRRLIRAFAVGQPRLDDKRVAQVDGRWPGYRGVKLPLDLSIEAVQDRTFADWRDAVRRRRHDLG